MHPSPLNQPVGAIMRPLPRVFPETSLEAAARVLRDTGGPIVAVYDNNVLHGFMTEASVAEALARGVQPHEPATLAANPIESALKPYSTGAEALRAFSAHGASAFVVTDDFDRPVGMLSPSDLFVKRPEAPTPGRIGGMATPFGVYLTNGTSRAGAGNLALVSTGMLLFTLLIIVTYGCASLAWWTYDALKWPAWAYYAIRDTLPTLLFLTGMRLMPLAGIHAAEHMVVHAIERGEELRPEIVKRMPRVHPRCGTNIAVGAMLFFAIGGAHWIDNYEFRTGLALLATLALWKPLGSFVQYWITTRTPTDKHIASGIRAGEELLRAQAAMREPRGTFGRRIWNSGMLHVMSGSFLMYGLILLLNWVFKLGLPVY